MSAIREAIVSQFGRPSGPLGRIAGWIMANRSSNRRRNEWGIALLAPTAGEDLLEIGCGPGYALTVAAKVGGVTIHAIDHSPLMVEVARRRVKSEAPGAKVSVEQGDLARLTEWPGRFDGIWSANVVQFLPDMTAAFGSIRHALKPGGRVVTVYQPRHKSPTRADAMRKAAEIEAAMQSAGFAGIRREVLELKPVPAVAVIGMKPISS